MTNFEKFKEDLTVDKLCNILSDTYSCKNCPAFAQCECDMDIWCGKKLKEYFESEVGNE